eukprot:4267860-Amphidinium_carterae.1
MAKQEFTVKQWGRQMSIFAVVVGLSHILTGMALQRALVAFDLAATAEFLWWTHKTVGQISSHLRIR